MSAPREDHSGGATDPMEAFAELGRITLDDTPMSAVLTRIAELAQATIPGVSHASVTVIDDGRASSVAFTGDLAIVLDERQYTDGFGPCTDAATSGATVAILDTRVDVSYPDFSRAAHRAGVTHTLSVGMPTPQRIVGGLNLYSTTNQPFTAEDETLAQTFASYAAVAVANAALYNTTAQLAGQMKSAMDSRAVIEQAKGRIMERTGVLAEEAFKMMTTKSQHENRKLRDIAADVAAGGPHT